MYTEGFSLVVISALTVPWFIKLIFFAKSSGIDRAIVAKNGRCYNRDDAKDWVAVRMAAAGSAWNAVRV